MNGSIMIVEDNENVREPLAALLKLKGYDVLEAENGEDALKQLRCAPRPALILLDLMMPVMDGWNFLGITEKVPALSSIPVVIVSAVATIKPPRHSPRIVAVMEKLFDMPGLIRLAEKYCRGGGGKAVTC